MKRIAALLVVLFVSMTAYITTLQAQTEQDKFSLGGFMAVNCFAYDFDEKHSLFGVMNIGRMEPAFSQSNLNIYFMYNSQKNWIALSEIKFTYLLNNNKVTYSGSDVYNEPPSYTYTDEMLRTYDLGGIFIERAYIEYNRFEFAKVRFGRFFTPFGIFSQDHGAPAVVSVLPPILVLPHGTSTTSATTNGMPLYQTGGVLLGSIYLSDFGIGYAAYMSNGPSEDPNANGDNVMCRGGFLNLIMPEIAEIINIEFGGSVYQGKRTYTKANYIDTGSFTADESNDIYNLKQRDFITAGHMKVSLSGLPLEGILLIQTEYLHQQVTDKEEMAMIGSGNPNLLPDYNYDVMYVQIEYQMFGILTPYFRYDYENISNENAPYGMFFLGTTQYTAGLNIKPIPNVSLKFEYCNTINKVNNLGKNMKINNDWRMYSFQATIAFL